MREFELLHEICTASGPGGAVLIGPGDDLALLAVGDEELLAGVDQLVDGRHVDVSAVPLALVGRKAITRSLSDVAAMAGRPLAALAAVTLPPDFGRERALGLFEAMRRTGQQYGCPLVGGDIAFHEAPGPPLVCSVTVLARPGPAGAVLRSGAQAGDTVYVTGALGGSVDAGGGGRHLTFEPRLAEGLRLAEALGERLRAMIDVSDGLGRDAGHIAAASGVRIELDAASLPRAGGASWQSALGDGEDYELCFAASGPVPRTVGNVAVTAVGRVVAGQPGVVVRAEGRLVDASELGWEHKA